MKKILFAVALFATVPFHSIFAQDSTQQNQLSQLLTYYYHVKDALVAGNAATASSRAGDFVKTLNGIDHKIISESNMHALLKDAGHISESKDLKKQREHFANFSNNMATLARTVKLGTQPIYQANCPMKKANWLSSDKAIKNPYYGSSMLTCGKVIETINR